MRQYDRQYFRQVVDDIFSTSDRGRANKLVEDYSKYWMEIKGTRGYTGVNTMNAHTNFNNHFEFEDGPTLDENGLNVELLEELENNLDGNT